MSETSQFASAPEIRTHVARDGYGWAVRVWPQEQPRARVILLHGIVSHGGWYLRSCRYLAARSLEVHFVDRRGAGLNEGARGDIDTHLTWLSDVEDYLGHLPITAPRLLLGISWGAKLAAAIAGRRGELLDGLGLIAPGIYARQFPSRLKYAALDGVRRLGMGSRSVPIPLQDPALFTDVPSWQSYIRTDPLTLRTVTIRFALADRELTRLARASATRIHKPCLMMLAGRDRIVENERMRQYHEQLASTDKALIEYPEAAHTFEFEPDPSRYFRDLERWIDRVSQ